ncbi:coiled-coil domain-containing protein 86 [Xiphias gladius]|uniref:coiled-coil domain-containing protein 86 n=1 Tax=Xiphias gladius TaxID=8245 RepID=UPI001A9927B0|nr:coiled-coil domain-containing protein 86 [Xiphias gladius]
MSRRQKAIPEEKTASEVGHEQEEEDVQDPPPETRRTRSGRRVRTPVALLESEAPVRTPSRRTRRSVLQELPAVEEKSTEEPERIPESVAEETPRTSAAGPEPCTVSELAARADVTLSGDGHMSRPALAETAPTIAETVPQKMRRLAPSGKQNPVIPLGKPKSGRVWKDRNKQRFSALVRDKPLCSSWEKKMEAKREKELVKRFSLQLKEEKAKQKEDKRKRREDNLKRRAENERKAEIVQVIRNTAKIKRMKRKQLRKVEKRDTLALLQKSQKQNVKAKGQKNNKTDKDLT